ncbi:3-methyl-2-oxobutanoate hydroxymethyltransferase [Methylopila capsulata]|uniref:3-methyl-2-oxobutanoate hydroxymethyltransferase n=1 Tax=Methylopila capsulata TaxID=61654 RepID=A0A9W6IV47_9HYPH|nr:3-methyl-2-oxobutanoate hydroxymethyltransferase [Methylopila capsulata]MBM7850589.1 3-methyl-2-oxobutanoate hydroxymethyltransferase [Methylopila capsulata]GLK55884.1 3-methyl-2-oxobutanoate hydroxymethyltransferase [Methylopila capsulata]
MSAHARPPVTAPAAKPVTVAAIRAAKSATPLVCLTAYTTPVAEALDEASDLLLVGDSLGMVVYGLPSTIPVTLDMMIAHGAAVVRGARHALVVVDLPFGAYQESPAQAFRNAARILAETGCGAVKLEGGAVMAETIAFLTQRGIPVLAHIGLQPQSVNALGGYAARGKLAAEAETILADARAVTDAGAFAVVVEGVVAPLAARITETIRVPTIGIGASAECDGQILVTDDMMGVTFGHVPKFVRKYADVGATMKAAAESYAADVRARRFPAEEHLYGMPKPKIAAG